MGKTSTVGVILAGGASRRMGEDKAGVRIPGSVDTLGTRAVAAVTAVVDDVVIVGHARAMPRGLRVVYDTTSYQGPLQALAAVLPTLSADRIVVVAVDMPGVLSADLQVLLDAADGGDGACYVDGDVFFPLPLVLRAPAFVSIAVCAARGERRMRAGVLSVPRLVTRTRPAGCDLKNINKVSDFDISSPGAASR